MKAERLEELATAYERAVRQERNTYGPPGSPGVRVADLLEQVLMHPAGISASLLGRMKSYARLYWLNRGSNDVGTGARLRPGFIPGELAAATQSALINGAGIDLRGIDGVPLEATRLEELEGLLKVVRPQIFRPQVPGLTTADAGATGSEEDAAPPPVATGLELVSLPDVELEGQFQVLASRLGVLDKRVRKIGGAKSVAGPGNWTRVVPSHAVVLGGPRGPRLPANVDPFGLGPLVRVGDRLHYLVNVAQGLDDTLGGKLVERFSPSPEIFAARMAWRPRLRPVFAWLREAVGRGLDGTQKKPADWFANRLGLENSVIIEEIRADLAALHLLFDDNLRTTGIVPSDDAAWAMVVDYVGSVCDSAAYWGTRERPPASASRVVVVRYLSEGHGVTWQPGSDGSFQPNISDRDALRKGVETLLEEVRRIRFVGDGAGAADLLSRLADSPVGFDEFVAKQLEGMDLPGDLAFMPILLETTGRGTADLRIQLTVPPSFLDRQLQVARSLTSLRDR